MTPEQLAKSGSEHAHQSALFCWAGQSVNPLKERIKWLHSIPNGAHMGPKHASKMIKEGMRAGVWDIFLPVTMGPFSGLYIEMKAPKHKGTSSEGMRDKQLEFEEHIISQGYAHHRCFSWEDARDVIINYMDEQSHT